jgi:hypothetical protein
LWALVRGLPLDSATWRSGWTQQDELMATQIEVTDRLGLRLARMFGAKSVPDPLRIEHPDRPEPEQKRLTSKSAEIAAFFRKHIKK